MMETHMSKPKQTKIARVQILLQRPSGARLEALCSATGWQTHSVHAALSGLRKAGHIIERTPGNTKAGASVYRIVRAADASS